MPKKKGFATSSARSAPRSARSSASPATSAEKPLRQDRSYHSDYRKRLLTDPILRLRAKVRLLAQHPKAEVLLPKLEAAADQLLAST